VSGIVSDLVTTVPKSLFKSALLFLLTNQFVISATQDCLYQCVAGTGIGLLHSADVSNCFFYAKCERHWRAEAMSGVLLYGRYHDDIIVVADGYAPLRHLHSELRRLSDGVFTIKCDEVASIGCSLKYLDLCIEVRSPRLQLSAMQDKVVTPLCPTSAHCPNVHKSWPSSICSRVFSLSGQDPGSLRSLYLRYELGNTHATTLDLISGWRPRVSSSNGERARLACDNVPFVLRYHPILKLAFDRALKQVPVPPELGVHCMAAWKNALPCISSYINRCNRMSCSVGKVVGSLCVSYNTSSRSLHEFRMSELRT
jgi:hypothetical protein